MSELDWSPSVNSHISKLLLSIFGANHIICESVRLLVCSFV